MRAELTRERIRELMREIARTAPRGGTYRVYLVGGGTAVFAGWRPSSIDADIYSDQDEVFRDIQAIKERLNVNVEFARPEQFVPPLDESDNRHVFIETIGSVSYYHYDPYAQILAKIVRGFDRDLEDARSFLESGMVERGKLRTLVNAIPDAAYARYPHLSRAAVIDAIDAFLAS
jgi:hypothetical protein